MNAIDFYNYGLSSNKKHKLFNDFYLTGIAKFSIKPLNLTGNECFRNLKIEYDEFDSRIYGKFYRDNINFFKTIYPHGSLSDEQLKQQIFVGDLSNYAFLIDIIPRHLRKGDYAEENVTAEGKKILLLSGEDIDYSYKMEPITPVSSFLKSERYIGGFYTQADENICIIEEDFIDSISINREGYTTIDDKKYVVYVYRAQSKQSQHQRKKRVFIESGNFTGGVSLQINFVFFDKFDKPLRLTNNDSFGIDGIDCTRVTCYNISDGLDKSDVLVVNKDKLMKIAGDLQETTAFGLDLDISSLYFDHYSYDPYNPDNNGLSFIYHKVLKNWTYVGSGDMYGMILDKLYAVIVKYTDTAYDNVGFIADDSSFQHCFFCLEVFTEEGVREKYDLGYSICTIIDSNVNQSETNKLNKTVYRDITVKYTLDPVRVSASQKGSSLVKLPKKITQYRIVLVSALQWSVPAESERSTIPTSSVNISEQILSTINPDQFRQVMFKN